MSKNAKDHLEILGKKVTDKISGCKGVATSVCFDLYGCVQVAVSRGFDGNGKSLDSLWFDIARLTPKGKPLMDQPDFFGDSIIADGKKGPAEKPSSQADGFRH